MQGCREKAGRWRHHRRLGATSPSSSSAELPRHDAVTSFLVCPLAARSLAVLGSSADPAADAPCRLTAAQRVCLCSRFRAQASSAAVRAQPRPSRPPADPQPALVFNLLLAVGRAPSRVGTPLVCLDFIVKTAYVGPQHRRGAGGQTHELAQRQAHRGGARGRGRPRVRGPEQQRPRRQRPARHRPRWRGLEQGGFGQAQGEQEPRCVSPSSPVAHGALSEVRAR